MDLDLSMGARGMMGGGMDGGGSVGVPDPRFTLLSETTKPGGGGGLQGEGVPHVINMLSDELERSLIQIGCPRLSELDRSWLSDHPRQTDYRNAR